MKIDVLTLFPRMFDDFRKTSMVARAIAKKKLSLKTIDIRDFAYDKHRSTDDYPYGGFAGMVMKPEPLYEAIKDSIKSGMGSLIYFTPQGRPLTQDIVRSYAKHRKVILLCGHYKEIDQRIRDLCVADEISLGDYVLSGGELAAMVFIDAVSRLQKGVLSDIDSAQTDSHEDGKLGFPCFTRPENFMGMGVPEVLRNGNHKLISEYVKAESDSITKSRRPDLLKD